MFQYVSCVNELKPLLPFCLTLIASMYTLMDVFMFPWLHLRLLVNENIKQMLLKSYISFCPCFYGRSRFFSYMTSLNSFAMSSSGCVMLCHCTLVACVSCGCGAPETLLDSGVGRGRAVSQMAKVALVHLAEKWVRCDGS